MFLIGSKQTELITSRLEQDEYYSLLKEIILLFANTHHRINATILLRFVPKMLHVSGELLVMSYGVVWIRIDYVSYNSQFILNLPRLRKGKRVWVFLTRFQNVAEVRRASQFHYDSMP